MIPFVLGAGFWSALGHRAMARVALELLTPTARAEVRAMLGSDNEFVSASVWADQVRPSRPATAPWHYVNVPLDSSGYDRERDCPTGDCVVEAIGYFRAVLADPAAPRVARVEALKLLVHFVGDIHQPLHVGERGDRGGNDYAVSFFGRDTNLHWVWDGALLEWAGWTEERLASEVARRAAALGPVGDEVRAWAAEAHQLSRRHAYPAGGATRLAEAYAEPNAAIALTQLARSAARLAALLNGLLDAAARSPSR